MILEKIQATDLTEEKRVYQKPLSRHNIFVKKLVAGEGLFIATLILYNIKSISS